MIRHHLTISIEPHNGRHIHFEPSNTRNSQIRVQGFEDAAVTNRGLDMKIGLLQIDLRFDGCNSLKDKRAILQALKHRIRQRYNVSLAEIDWHDQWRESRFGLVAIGNQADSIEKNFRAVIEEIESRPDTAVTDYCIEMM